MTKPITKSKHGFTIIEVVLVLAIAGLIFLMVFIALPALQRNQKNTQRRDDYSMLSTAVTSYMSNNGGRLSKIYGTSGKVDDLDPVRWVNSSGTDPDNNPYQVIAYSYSQWEAEKSPEPSNKVNGKMAYCKAEGHTIDDCPSGDLEEAVEGDPGSQVFIIVGANCNGSDSNGDAKPKEDRGSNAFAVYGYMDGGSYYCQANGSIGDK